MKQKSHQLPHYYALCIGECLLSAKTCIPHCLILENGLFLMGEFE